MTRLITIFLSTTLFAGAAIAAPATGASTPPPFENKPNVVLIVADDYGWSEAGFNYSPYYQTPHLDKLAANGLVFTDAYAAAANCAPSRACMLTGLSSPRHGIYTVKNSDRGEDTQRKLVPTENVRTLNMGFATIADVLKKHGYRTGAFGKWHISESPQDHGFDVSFAGNAAGHPKTYWAPYQGLETEGEEGEYLTDRVTDEACNFIRESRREPFFLYLPFFAVHDPLQGRPELVEKYEGLPSKSGQGRSADYSAMIENMDASVGRIVNMLDIFNLVDDTILIFTSDNGGAEWISSQTPLKGGKGSYYEGGIRVPFLVHYPAFIKEGRTSDMPVTGLDVFPTIAELTGAEVPATLTFDGMSFAPMLRDSRVRRTHRALHWHFPIYLHAHKGVAVPDGVRDPSYRTRPGTVMRYGNWKLHEYFEDGALELYNLREDIGERRNLARKNPEMVEKLHGMMKAWRDGVDAPVPEAENPDYDPSVHPEGYDPDPRASLKYVSDQYRPENKAP
jgi:arylsulfatase A-like enzyme